MLTSTLSPSYGRLAPKLTKLVRAWDRTGFNVWRRLTELAWTMVQGHVHGKVYERVEDELFKDVDLSLEQERGFVQAWQAPLRTHGSYEQQTANKMYSPILGYVTGKIQKRVGRVINSAEERILSVMALSARERIWHRTIVPFFRIVNGVMGLASHIIHEES